MDSFWDIMSGAPWWVYGVLAYLVIVGIQATKSRTISTQRLVILPAVFVALAIYGLYGKVMLGFTSLIPLWILSLAVGAYLGLCEVRSWKISVDRHKGEITIPGNYSTLVLMLLIFGLKFFWGYYYATHTVIPDGIYFADVISSAFVTGFFVGRAGFFYKLYQKK